MLARHAWIVLATSLLAACAADKDKPPAKSSGDAGNQSDSSTDETPVTDEAQFLNEYATAVCEMYAPCCKAEDLGYDRSGCSEWYRKIARAYFPGEFRPDAAASCLEHVAEARKSDSERCSQVLDFAVATLREECRQAFAAPAREGKALGQSCMLAGDCASSTEGPVICSSRLCLLQLRGNEGDGPCYLSGRSNDEGPPTRFVTCDAKDGLYCHRADNVCRPQVGDGEACPYPGACMANGLCTGGRCVALPAPGERCANAVPGAGGFCRAGSACDRTTLICGPALPLDAACREPAQCASQSCMEGKCTKPEFTRALNCTGR
ncbi:MAG TPA: hypothetical protein VJV78_08505 [Polyangiales bacterium]|nr:hypothetical protein [Polyangiales bacterium]